MIKLKNNQIKEMVDYLNDNKVLIIKTDTVWGLLSFNEQLLYKLKQRPKNKLFVRLINFRYKLANLSSIQIKFIKRFWPGDVTIIKDKIAYRISNDNTLLSLTNQIDINLKSLYLTSANIHNEKTIETLDEAQNIFKLYSQDCILIEPDDNQLIVDSIASTIIDIDEWKIIRSGKKINHLILWIYTNFYTINKNIRLTNKLNLFSNNNQLRWIHSDCINFIKGMN